MGGDDGLEPTTPCLQIRPTRTAANSDERLRQIRPDVRMFANRCGRLRMVHKWSIAALGAVPPQLAVERHFL